MNEDTASHRCNPILDIPNDWHHKKKKQMKKEKPLRKGGSKAIDQRVLPAKPVNSKRIGPYTYSRPQLQTTMGNNNNE